MTKKTSDYVPVVGGYDWRREVNELTRLNREEVKVLQELMEAAATPATIKRLAWLLGNRTLAADKLHRLQRYRGRDNE